MFNLAIVGHTAKVYIDQTMLILHWNIEFSMAGYNFPLKKGIFWPMGQKDGDFLFWSMIEPMETFFGVEKADISLRSFFWNTL